MQCFYYEVWRDDERGVNKQQQRNKVSVYDSFMINEIKTVPQPHTTAAVSLVLGAVVRVRHAG